MSKGLRRSFAKKPDEIQFEQHVKGVAMSLSVDMLLMLKNIVSFDKSSEGHLV